MLDNMPVKRSDVDEGDLKHSLLALACFAEARRDISFLVILPAHPGRCRADQVWLLMGNVFDMY